MKVKKYSLFLTFITLHPKLAAVMCVGNAHKLKKSRSKKEPNKEKAIYITYIEPRISQGNEVPERV